jgi:hypothetical protein
MFSTGALRKVVLSGIAIATLGACDSGSAVTPVACSESPLESGASASGTLSAADCTVNGRYMQLYNVSVLPGEALLVDMMSADVDSYLRFMTTARVLLAENDDVPVDSGVARSPDSQLVVLAPPGQYLVGATTYAAGETGAYTVSTGTHSGLSEDCTAVWIVPGITTTQYLTPTDSCGESPYYLDWFAVKMTRGQSVTVTMRSTEMDAYLFAQSASTGGVVAQNNDFEPGVSTDARITITAAAAGTYWILPSSNVEGQTGQYTLTIQ